MTRHTAFPDLLGRHDAEHGTWEVLTGVMRPGMAWTQPGDRRMSVPHGDTDNERVVRAHEMMHAKVSPQPADLVRWVERRRASLEALTHAEEFRVNTLVKRAGFDVSVLTDGGETVAGERVTESGNWQQAVFLTASFANTGRFKPFLVGVRRKNPEWAKTLRALHDRLVKEINKFSNEVLASTGEDPKTGLRPWGYRFTEQIAVLLEHAGSPPESPRDGTASDDPVDEQPVEAPPVTEDQLKQVKLDASAPVAWDDLRWSRPGRPKRAPGGIGSKKRPAGTGRAPTRLSRELTDPYRRVFDRRVRGKGGVVLIDASASMRFDQDDVMAIVEAAPGCTVAMYCGNTASRRNGSPNIWLLADRGKMVDEIPRRSSGNGCDLPAVRWAISARQRKDSPVVWVTDGGCHGPGQGYVPSGGVDCAKAVIEGGVVLVPNVGTAVTALRGMASGKRPARWWPVMWRDSWKAAFGKPLR